ncbi:MAG: hypothetical protein H6832_10375 [Planctomycetes bacterium]|nr:hypothetical protein [Planctomycetota bacterium]
MRWSPMVFCFACAVPATQDVDRLRLVTDRSMAADHEFPWPLPCEATVRETFASEWATHERHYEVRATREGDAMRVSILPQPRGQGTELSLLVSASGKLLDYNAWLWLEVGGNAPARALRKIEATRPVRVPASAIPDADHTKIAEDVCCTWIGAWTCAPLAAWQRRVHATTLQVDALILPAMCVTANHGPARERRGAVHLSSTTELRPDAARESYMAPFARNFARMHRKLPEDFVSELRATEKLDFVGDDRLRRPFSIVRERTTLVRLQGETVTQTSQTWRYDFTWKQSR